MTEAMDKNYAQQLVDDVRVFVMRDEPGLVTATVAEGNEADGDLVISTVKFDPATGWSCNKCEDSCVHIQAVRIGTERE